MPKARLDKPVPDIKLSLTGGENKKLSDFSGTNLVLYFYPKDDTPGCTTEGSDFRDSHAKFKRRNTVILGVSRDSLESHEKFKAKLKFPFDLVSDPDEKLCKLFDVIQEKNMYGKKVMGVERSTFIIDAEGVLKKEWRKVKVDGHVDEVLAALKDI